MLDRPVIGIHLPGERDLLLLDAETSRYAGGGDLGVPDDGSVPAVVRESTGVVPVRRPAGRYEEGRAGPLGAVSATPGR